MEPWFSIDDCLKGKGANEIILNQSLSKLANSILTIKKAYAERGEELHMDIDRYKREKEMTKIWIVKTQRKIKGKEK